MKLRINDNCKGGSLKIYQFTLGELLSNKKLFSEAYLEGHLIVIEKFRPHQVSHDILNQCYELSKTSSPPKKPFAKDFCRSLTKDETLERKILIELQKSERIIFSLFTKLLSPSINLSKLKFQNASTWRSQLTTKEGYHLDIYKATSLRAYWNLSPNPRLWGIGHRSCDLIELLPENKKHKATQIAEEFKNNEGLFQFKMNSYLNNEILDDLEQHNIQFEQHDLWICDGLKACHQIISGDMMAGFDYPAKAIDNKSNDLKQLRNYAHWLMNNTQSLR